jgi:hypothetical protein
LGVRYAPAVGHLVGNDWERVRREIHSEFGGNEVKDTATSLVHW